MRRRPLLLTMLLVLAGPANGRAQDPPRDFAAFTRRQPNGLVDVDALALPDAFITRVADRSLRRQFRLGARRVAPDPAVDAAPGPASDPASGLRVIAEPLAPEVIERWRAYLDDVPLLRGFRPPRLAHADDAWPIDPPHGRDAERYRRAARLVAERLARDGLVRTTMEVVRTADLPWTTGAATDATLDEKTFRAAGVPIDLLAFFFVDDRPVADTIAAWIEAGAPRAAIDDIAGRARFRFAPTRAGFTAAAQDGTVPIAGLRLQVSGPRLVRGPGEGSAVDVLRQLATAGPETPLWVSVHHSKIDALLETIGSWDLAAPERLSIVLSPAGVSDWAQDNGVPGLLDDASGRRRVTLVPRYANRNEQVSKLLVGDTLVFETLTGVVGEALVSPLLFQGGNVLRVVDPASGEGVLLVGEAEIHRNRGLGLTAPQVTAAFAAEFGARRVIVLPAISFHVDMEVAVRRVGDELVAFVVDDVAGARHVVAAGLAALERGGVIDAGAGARLTGAIATGPALPALIETRRALNGRLDERGALTADVAAAFRSQSFESAAANAGRFMLAVDVLVAASVSGTATGPSTPERQYVVSLRRRLRERMVLAETLASHGFRVQPIPAIGDDELGINAVNVVHTSSSMLVPVAGGLFAPLDTAALRAFGAVLGDDVTLVPVASGHAQTRFGGVHCLVAAYP